MDKIKTIEEIAQLMEKYNLSEISVVDGDFKVGMSKRPPHPPMMPPMPTVAPAVQPAQSTTAAAAPQAADTGKYVRAPIVGTFYAASAPGKPPYAPVGKTVNKGDVVFIIESMKLMNEVKSDVSGTVVEVLVSDGEAVEYDQPILRLE